jgi:CheY-like chemotaxis protein
MARTKHILIADDDAALRRGLAEMLEADGAFVVSEAATAAKAASLITARDVQFDLLLLDVGLPDGDGRELCERLRRQGIRVPIVMLTGSAAEADVVRGLDAGANDYIIKPFRCAELVARLRAQLRAHETSDDVELMIGGPEIPVSGRRQASGPQRAAARGVGLQCIGRHAHGGNPHLSTAPEDRTGPKCNPAVGERGRWLSIRHGTVSARAQTCGLSAAPYGRPGSTRLCHLAQAHIACSWSPSMAANRGSIAMASRACA